MSQKMMTRTYSGLSQFNTIAERYEYLRLSGAIGDSTFGFDRYLNQALYTSKQWRSLRDDIIIRDNGCDMGLECCPIGPRIIVHHMNPLTIEDIENRCDDIFNPEFLICVSSRTHNAIHFGDNSLLPKPHIERRPGDTCPWR